MCRSILAQFVAFRRDPISSAAYEVGEDFADASADTLRLN